MRVPKLTPVTSSSVAALGHDAASKRLFVRFPSGATYSYANVSPEGFQAFLAAGSKGAHLRRFFLGREHTKH